MATVSVIIPVYNAERYLPRCLDSVLAQTLQDIEVICVDDGSSDGSVAILKEYAARDSRLRLIRQKNAGAGAARNQGLRESSGEYLSFLDSDDFFEPDMLEKAVSRARQFDAEIVVFDSDQYHMDKDCFVHVPWVIVREDLPPYMPFTYRQLTGNVFLSFVGWAWDKLYRRDFVQEHNLWFQEQRTTNDMLFVFSGLVTAKRIAVLDEILAHQRRGSADSLSVTREKSWHCFYNALISLRNRLEDEGIYWELEQDFINYSLHFSLWHLNSLAQPTHDILKRRLRNGWFRELGVAGKPAGYFYNQNEYAQFVKLMK